jgi:hypothetical protein
VSAIDEARKLRWYCELCASAPGRGSVMHPIGEHTKPEVSWPRPVVQLRPSRPAGRAERGKASVLHRTGRGWTAVWRPRVVPKLRLPGDTPGLLAALHALTRAGLLAPNTYAADVVAKPCPRCGRNTATWRDVKVSVCTACRVERLAVSASSLGEWNRSVYGRQP